MAIELWLEEDRKALRLTAEMKAEAARMPRGEARYLVDAYYQVQHYRIASENQGRMNDQGRDEPPTAVIGWLTGHMGRIEDRIRSLLLAYAEAQEVGAWSLSICGIGPVIAAGLLAHIDITRAPTVGHIWRFAGLDPTQEWGKGEKRPWNARLKTLCWKIGESFVKVSGNKADFYGHLYAQRKLLEQERNEAGAFAGQAAATLSKKRYGEDTKAREFYERGQLPPAHIHERAKRPAVKLFLSHWHEVAYESAFGQAPPKPFVLEHLGHVSRIEVPNWR